MALEMATLVSELLSQLQVKMLFVSLVISAINTAQALSSEPHLNPQTVFLSKYITEIKATEWIQVGSVANASQKLTDAVFALEVQYSTSFWSKDSVHLWCYCEN